jgi:hypothetical protein
MTQRTTREPLAAGHAAPQAGASARRTRNAPGARAEPAPGAHGMWLQRKCACAGKPATSAQPCAECQGSELLQRRAVAGRPAVGVPAIVRDVLAAPGRPLDAPTRQFMEGRLGHDLSDVRVHDDTRAGESARAVDAEAYTVGQDIVFASGQYRPESTAGRHLIAHELVHTLQQRGLSRGAAPAQPSAPGSEQAFEAEADRVADAVIAGQAAPPISRATQPMLARQTRPWGGIGGAARSYALNPAGLGDVTFTITARSNSSDTDADGRPTAVAFRIDKFFLPSVKGNSESAYAALAARGELEATIRTDQRIAPLTQGRAPTDQLRALWAQKYSWPSNCAAALWHAAGGDPERPSGATAVPLPSGTDLNAPSFAKVAGNTCEVDHIVELQLTGTNVPNNLQMLDHDANQRSGWEAIWPSLQGLASRIREDLLHPEHRPDVILHFAGVEVAGRRTRDAPRACTPDICARVADGRARFCWQVECCAAAASAPGCSAPAAAPAATPYPLQAASSAVTLHGPARNGADQTIDLDPPADALNLPARDVIAGLALTSMTLRSASVSQRGTKDRLAAVIDVTRDGRRARASAVLEALESQGARVELTRDPRNNTLALLNPRQALRFQYPYLSQAVLNVRLNQGALEGTGTLTPSVPLLNRFQLHLDLNRERLRAEFRGDPNRLRSPLPGLRFTEMGLGADLLPEFEPSGRIAFEVSAGRRVFLNGQVEASRAPEGGLLLAGDLFAHLPGTDRSQGHVQYTNRAWSGYVVVESSKIRLPGFQRGELRVDFNADGTIRPSGSVELLIAGNPVLLSAAYESGRVVLAGRANIRVPGLRPVVLELRHDGEHLTGAAATGVSITGLDGDVRVQYRDGRVSGRGTVALRRGRASGSLTLELSEAGNLFGEGTASVRLTNNLIGNVSVRKPERGPLRVDGELRFPNPIRLFSGVNKQHTLFERTLEFPIPGLSIPIIDVGVIATLTGRLKAGYGFGPGVLEDVHVGVGFNPLDEEADLAIDAGGRLVIPAHAELSLSIRAGAGLSAGVASITGGLTATGTVGLTGGFSGAVEFHYRHGSYSLEADAAIRVRPVFRLSLDADVTAEVGAFGYVAASWQKVWNLAGTSWAPDVEAGLVAHLSYSPERGLVVPDANQIDWIEPRIDVGDVLRDLFGRARSTERDLE